MVVRRELDARGMLTAIGAGVPEPVLAVLADDRDALTSHFAILAGPDGASAARLLHRRVRELANEHHAAARTAEQLVRRVAQLEARNGDRSTETGNTPSVTATPPSVVEPARPGEDQMQIHRDLQQLG